MKRLAGATLLLAGLLLTAGCTAAEEPPTAASEEENTEVETVVEECAEATVNGDAVVGVPASNSAGSYCTIVVNPDSAALKYDSTKTDPRLYDLGYTDEQLENMQRQAVEFTVAQLIDNPGIGEPRVAAEAWLSEHGSKHLRQDIVDGYLSTQGSDEPLLAHDITFGTGQVIPGLAYGGDSRVKNVTLTVTGVGVRSQREDETAVTTDAEVVLDTVATYRVDSAEYPEWRKAYGRDVIREGSEPQAELDALNFDAPLFADAVKVFKIGYEEDEVKSNTGRLIVRSSLSTLMNNVFAYN